MPAPSASIDASKQLSIKMNTIKRYIKDISYYQKELEGQQSKLTQLKESPDCCPHVLKKHLEGIAETEAMIPDCQERLQKARDDLQEFLEQNSELPSASEARTLLVSQN